MARRRRGGRCEAELHTDAQRLPAEADYPARVKKRSCWRCVAAILAHSRA